MRFFILLFLTLGAMVVSITSCSDSAISSEQLVYRDSLMYKVNEQKPYTGKVVDTLYNGVIGTTGQYKNGLYHGEWIEYHDNGQQASRLNYRMGKLDGDFEEYEMNGKLVEKGVFTNGLREGPWETHYEDGTHDTKEYKVGNLHGTYIYYDENNMVVTQEEYKDGNLHGTKKSFFPSSTSVQISASYVDGKQHGESIEYWDNGKVKTESKYSKDELKSRKMFTKTGELTSKAVYPGKRIWYKNGNKTAEASYLDEFNIDPHSVVCYYPNGKTFTLKDLCKIGWRSICKSNTYGNRLQRYRSDGTCRYRYHMYYNVIHSSKFKVTDDFLPNFSFTENPKSRDKKRFSIVSYDGKKMTVNQDGNTEYWTISDDERFNSYKFW